MPVKYLTDSRLAGKSLALMHRSCFCCLYVETAAILGYFLEIFLSDLPFSDSYYVWKIYCNHVNKALGQSQGLIFAIIGDPRINFFDEYYSVMGYYTSRLRE